MTDESERREHDRLMCTLYLKLDDPDGNEVARVVDLSQGGLLVTLQTALDVGAELKGRVNLPKAWGDAPPMDIELLCRWTRMDVADGYFVSGMQFTKINERDRHALNRLMEEFTFEGRYHPFPDLLYRDD